jgi:hypothetical protein
MLDWAQEPVGQSVNTKFVSHLTIEKKPLWLTIFWAPSAKPQLARLSALVPAVIHKVAHTKLG